MQDGWMHSLRGFLHGIEWTMFRGHLDCFQRPSLGGGRSMELIGRPLHSERSQPVGLLCFIMCEDTHG
jgi:hypothetical protein